MGPLSLAEAANTIAIVRDIVLIVIVSATTLVLLFLFRKVSKVLDSAATILDRVENIAETMSSRIVGPAAAGTGVAFGAGKLAAFVLGFSKKRKKEGGEDNGK